MKPQDLVRPEILAIGAYHVAPAEGMVKLDAMENPYPLPPALRRELAQALAAVDLNRYPDPSAPKLRELLARKMAVPPGMEILLGNGSDDLIQVLALALARPGAVMMYPAPTFVMYSMDALFCGMRAVPVPLAADFSLDAGAFIERMRAEKPALVFIAYPNNPTGVLYPEEQIVEVIKACPGLVVIDEAYHVFAGKTFMQRLPEFPNLLVLRPADAVETAEAWQVALQQKHRPSVLALTRQDLAAVRVADSADNLVAKGGYELLYLEEKGRIRAVAGIRFLENLASGRVLYVDDLVTDTGARVDPDLLARGGGQRRPDDPGRVGPDRLERHRRGIDVPPDRVRAAFLLGYFAWNTRRMITELGRQAATLGIPFWGDAAGAMFGFFFAESPVSDWDGAAATDRPQVPGYAAADDGDPDHCAPLTWPGAAWSGIDKDHARQHLRALSDRRGMRQAGSAAHSPFAPMFSVSGPGGHRTTNAT